MSLVSRLSAAVLLCSLSAAVAASAQTNVLTQHNDIGRTGQNLTETILTPENVKVNTFGKLYSIPIDGQAYAQPLYLSSLAIKGVNHSVLFVATEHDTVTAYDTNARGAVLWQADMKSTAHGAAAGATSDPTSTTGCTDVQGPEYGIRGTPVIDPATNTLYTTARTMENGQVVWRFHALDITTGNEKFGGPVVVTASIAGSAPDAVNGQVVFAPKWQNQRPGLLLINGTVYTAWGAVCDFNTWHGWIIGYSAASGTLQQTTAFITTPNGSASGIWMVGSGLAADTENGVSRIFATTGNGTYDAAPPYGTNTMDYGDDILALTQSSAGGLTVSDEFTPRDQQYLENYDVDLGSGGLVVLPDNLPGSPFPHQAVQIGKSGNMFLLNRDNLGGYSPNVNGALQEVDDSGLWGTPGYWNGNVYFWPNQSNLRQYSLTNGALSTVPIAQGPITRVTNTGHPFLGSTVSISANGNTAPIVWASDYVSWAASTVPVQYFYAYDGTNVANLLWSSDQLPGRDGAGSAQKYAVPTIADGKVYLASGGYIMVYGLVPADFTITVPQAFVSIPPSSSANIPLTTNLYGGLTGTVAFSVSGMPSGVTASISSGSVLTLNVAANAPPTSGAAAIVVTGSLGTITHSLTLLLNVSNADVPISLSSAANVYAIQTDGSSPINGGLDNNNYAYSAKLMGTSLNFGGVPYIFGAPGVADAVSSATISIPPAAGSISPLNLIATAQSGSAPNQVFTLTYTDGTTSKVSQSLSDWGYPSGFPGESNALSMAYRLTPSGTTNNGPWYLYQYTLRLTAGKVLASVTLPPNRAVVILAATTGPAVGSTPQTITFAAIPTQAVGVALTLGATSTSSLAVNYVSSTTGVCTVNGSTATMVAAGTCTITASQAGNSSYVAATPVAQSFTVAKTQTITFSAIAAQTVGASLTLKASATSGLPITFTSATPGFCSVSGSTVSSIAAGTCTIAAAQAGNGTYASAAPVSQSFTVTPLYQAAVNLSSAFNVYGIFNSGAQPINGGFDTSNYAFPGNLLGRSIAWAGSQFTLGAPGVKDAVTSVQVPLPAGSFSTIQLLASGAYGTQANQPFVLTYSDGTTSTVTQSISDWGLASGYPGETIAFSSAYRVQPNGTPQTGPWIVYGYSFPVNPAKTLSSITLPNNRNVVVFAMTLSSTTPISSSTLLSSYQAAASMSQVDNAYAITGIGAQPVNGGFDNAGYAFPASQLPNPFAWNGSLFTFGNPGVPDAASSTTVPLPLGSFSSLQMLASGAFGTQTNQPFVLTYSDGTTATLTQSISDWGYPSAYAGEAAPLATLNRVAPDGSLAGGPWIIFGYSFPVNPAKTPISITLPKNRSVVVFAITLSSNAASSIASPALPLGPGQSGTTQVLPPPAGSTATVIYTVAGLPPGATYTIQAGAITITTSSTTPPGTYPITVTTASGTSISVTTFTLLVSSPPLVFVPITPYRAVDTRNAAGAFGGPAITTGSPRSFALPAGNAVIPANVAAYSVNVTVVPSAPVKALHVWATGQPEPSTSVVVSDGRAKAQAAIVAAGTGGSISVDALGSTHVIVDVNGYFVPASSTVPGLQFYPVTPFRAYDTRSTSTGGPYLAAGQTRNFKLAGVGGVPAGAQALSLNFTVVPKAALGNITVWPAGSAMPNTSTLSDGNGTVIANAAIVPVGTGGAVSVSTTDTTDLLVDVNGYFAAPAAGGLSFYTTPPVNVFNGPTSGMAATNAAFAISLAKAVPTGAKALVLNAAVTPAVSYIAVWPDGAAQPNVSTLNNYDGSPTSNLAIVPFIDGSIDVFGVSPAVFSLDLTGYFAP